MALIEIDGLPFLKMGGFSMAMLNNQMVFFAITIGLFEHITLDCFLLHKVRICSTWI